MQGPDQGFVQARVPSPTLEKLQPNQQGGSGSTMLNALTVQDTSEVTLAVRFPEGQVDIE